MPRRRRPWLPTQRPTPADIALLNFAESFELAARDLYQASIDAGNEDDLVKALAGNHRGFADVIKGILGTLPRASATTRCTTSSWTASRSATRRPWRPPRASSSRSPSPPTRSSSDSSRASTAPSSSPRSCRRGTAGHRARGRRGDLRRLRRPVRRQRHRGARAERRLIMTSPNEPPGASRGIGRRQLLQTGGITVSLAALLAACGESSSAEVAPGRVGYAPVPTDLPTEVVDDGVRLRTAQSIEHLIIDLYEQLSTSAELYGPRPGPARRPRRQPRDHRRGPLRAHPRRRG